MCLMQRIGPLWGQMDTYLFVDDKGHQAAPTNAAACPKSLGGAQLADQR